MHIFFFPYIKIWSETFVCVRLCLSFPGYILYQVMFGYQFSKQSSLSSQSLSSIKFISTVDLIKNTENRCLSLNMISGVDHHDTDYIDTSSRRVMLSHTYHAAQPILCSRYLSPLLHQSEFIYLLLHSSVV